MRGIIRPLVRGIGNYKTSCEWNYKTSCGVGGMIGPLVRRLVGEYYKTSCKGGVIMGKYYLLHGTVPSGGEVLSGEEVPPGEEVPCGEVSCGERRRIEAVYKSKTSKHH